MKNGNNHKMAVARWLLLVTLCVIRPS